MLLTWRGVDTTRCRLWVSSSTLRGSVLVSEDSARRPGVKEQSQLFLKIKFIHYCRYVRGWACCRLPATWPTPWLALALDKPREARVRCSVRLHAGSWRFRGRSAHV